MGSFLNIIFFYSSPQARDVSSGLRRVPILSTLYISSRAILQIVQINYSRSQNSLKASRVQAFIRRISINLIYSSLALGLRFTKESSQCFLRGFRLPFWQRICKTIKYIQVRFRPWHRESFYIIHFLNNSSYLGLSCYQSAQAVLQG